MRILPYYHNFALSTLELKILVEQNYPNGNLQGNSNGFLYTLENCKNSNKFNLYFLTYAL